MFNIAQRFIRTLALAAFFTIPLLGPGTVKATMVGDLPDISLLTPFAEFGHAEVESLVTINGNVGVSNNGTLSLNAPSVINGDVYVGLGATFNHVGTVHGMVHTGVDLSANQAQVFSASSAFSGFSPDFTSLGTGNFSATVGNVTVVTLSNLNLNNQNITFAGAGYLVLNITSSFSLTGTASILDADPTHVFINYTGTSTLNTHVDDAIDGYTFIPNADATLDGTFVGGLYGGNGTITLLSNAVVTSPPGTVPDGGSAVALLAIALAGLEGTRRLIYPKRKFHS